MRSYGRKEAIFPQYDEILLPRVEIRLSATHRFWQERTGMQWCIMGLNPRGASTAECSPLSTLSSSLFLETVSFVYTPQRDEKERLADLLYFSNLHRTCVPAYLSVWVLRHVSPEELPCTVVFRYSFYLGFKLIQSSVSEKAGRFLRTPEL